MKFLIVLFALVASAMCNVASIRDFGSGTSMSASGGFFREKRASASMTDFGSGTSMNANAGFFREKRQFSGSQNAQNNQFGSGSGGAAGMGGGSMGGMGGGSYGSYGSYGGDYGSCYADDYACQTAFDNCYGDAYCETAVDACVTDYYTEYGATYGDEASYQTCLDATITSAGRKLNKIKLTSTASPAKDGSWPYSAGVVIYGTEELDTSYPTYCDHYHLYSFVISDVQPADSADSYALDFSGHGWTMMGFPGMCDYTDWAAIDYELFEDVVYATTGDQFAMTCGYYSEYEWSGYQSVFFQVDSMNALAKAVSAFALVATSALFL